MSDATPPPESLCSTPTPESVCATLPPESPSTTPTPELVHGELTAYYYMSSKGRRLYPDTSSLTPYKPLPGGWDESEHYWLYGWPASNRILQSLLYSYFKLSHLSVGPLHDASLVLILLDRLSGYAHLTRMTCKPSEEAQLEGIVELRYCGLPGVPFLMVSCTAKKRLFTQRPTVEQLDYLSSILGEPRWLEAIYSKEEFFFDIVQ